MSAKKPSVTIRRGTPADARGIRDAHIASIRGLCVTHYSQAQVDVWSSPRPLERYRKAMTEKGESYFVAAQGRRVVGFAAWKDEELCAIYIHPRVAGQGVGKRLLEQAERDAMRKGVRRFRMHASLNALPFYRSQGYRVYRYAMHPLRRSGITIRCAKMTKRLTKTGCRLSSA
ncbi:MAG: GNAT family N-acetyltransferase [Planctomycetes bacterium]|nr:GNAT family N-acetyltransferase [Planctomycetota bacterium]NUQ33757.1 GNAT family N-acetyltransferase [Planctomycetaceae bacterium]